VTSSVCTNFQRVARKRLAKRPGLVRPCIDEYAARHFRLRNHAITKS